MNASSFYTKEMQKIKTIKSENFCMEVVKEPTGVEHIMYVDWLLAYVIADLADTTATADTDKNKNCRSFDSCYRV